MYYTLLSVLHVAVLVAVALRLFSRRNTNGSAMAWLMLVILVPLVGVLMYLLIGERRLGPGRRGRAAGHPPGGRPGDTLWKGRGARSRLDRASGRERAVR